MLNLQENGIHNFPTIWDAYLSFENMTRRKGEPMNSFVSRWKENMKLAQSAGCNYSDTVLACKLLHKVKLDKEETKNMVNSIHFSPSEMLSILLYSLDDYSGQKPESQKDQSVKNEIDSGHSKHIKEEFPEEAQNVSKRAVQSEEELLLEIELKEEPPEDIQASSDVEQSKSAEEQADEGTEADITNDHEIDDDDDGGGKDPKDKKRKKHMKGERHHCNLCTKSFTQATSLKKHFMQQHTNERPFRCTQCSFGAVRRGELKRHMRCHTGEKPFKCPLCEKAFQEKKSLKYHFVRAHSSENSFKCKLCSYWSPEKIELTRHMRAHSEKQPIKCRLCEKTFSLKKYLKRHMLVNHAQEDFEENDGSKLKNEGENLESGDIELNKDPSEPLKEEMQESTDFKESKELAESSMNNLGDSQVIEVIKQSDEKREIQRLQCEHCGKDFSSRGTLRVHYSVCPNLDEEERNSKGYKHVRIQKKITCKTCNKTLVGQYNYRRHLSLHTSERNFICDICPATFTSSYYLEFHKYRHKKGKWRHCDSCDKSFSQTGELKRHIMRMHTDERPFQCPHCAYKTVAKFHLDRHIRSHTGETPFKCNLCGKMYRDKKSVKRHINAHHGYCDEKYIGRNPTISEKHDAS